MKKIVISIIVLMLAFLPFFTVASNCDDIKIDLQSRVQSLKNALPSLESDIVYTRSGIYSLFQKSDEFQALANGNSDIDVKNAYNYAANSCRVSYQSYAPYSESLLQDYFTISNRIYTLSSSIDSIDCSSCSSGSSSTNCCDFTEIIQAINACSGQLDLIRQETAGVGFLVGQAGEWLELLVPYVETGFYNVTNLLEGLNGYLHTNLFNISKYTAKTMAVGKGHYLKSNGTYGESSAITMTSPRPNDNSGGILGAILSENFYSRAFLGSLNNYSYYFRTLDFPILTNTVRDIHRDQTNYFSFFRGEIGVRGVLEDWQSEEVSGTYYDFLTNHYLSVVFGESLSGYQAEKTNWFSRIETLLAALVFVDESETNAYLSASEASSNSVSNAKDSFNSVFDGVSSAPSTQMELAVDIEKSMYNSLKSFSQAFSSASLPSTVRLLYVYKDGGGGGSLRKGALRSSGGSVDVSVDVDGKLSDFIEILRSCSTLCWVFFGLWFMFKFTVWTVKKIYFLIRYIIDFFNMVAGGK